MAKGESFSCLWGLLLCILFVKKWATLTFHITEDSSSSLSYYLCHADY